MFNLATVPVPSLQGKTILVTGAGRGIGAELVRQLVDHGAQVFAGFYGAADMGALAGAVTFPLDVTDAASVAAAVAKLEAFGGRLDVLVNNAGVIAPIGHLEHLPADTLKPAFEVNVVGLQRMTMACLPLLKASKGVIVNAGTGAATTPMEGWTAYCVSKAGARMLTQMMALELAPHGIQSFFIGIPPTDTAMQSEIRQAGLNPISQIPQEKLVPTDVPASVMAWLCSDEARSLDEVLLDVRHEHFTAMMNL
ncbi:MAG: SDR family oxidoreductase [Rubellimicrobium sp.]|nr:SDR family oxidoreductase [Rubellimicrobium sp.]